MAGAPAIVDGSVFAASIGGVVASLDVRTGHARWRRCFPTPVYGSGKGARRLGFFGGVAVAKGRVLAASDRVISLDADTGRTLWETKPLRTSTSDDYFWGPPVVANGLVLVGSGSGAELPTARGRLSAYSLKDGSLVWSTATVPPGANGGGIIAPASVDLRANLAYVATGSPYRAVPGRNPGTGSLLALHLSDGAIVWSDQIYPADRHGFDFNSAPVILGRILVAASKDGFHAWNRVTRQHIWHRRLTPALSKKGGVAGPMNGPEGGPVATDGRRIYVLSNDAARKQLCRGGSRTGDRPCPLETTFAGIFVCCPGRRRRSSLPDRRGRNASWAGYWHWEDRRGCAARRSEHRCACSSRGTARSRCRCGALPARPPTDLYPMKPIGARHRWPEK